MAAAIAPANADRKDLAAVLAEKGAEGASDGSPDAHQCCAEAELRKAEARYRALVEQIPAVSFLAPLDGTVTGLYVSPQIEQLLGFTAEEWRANPTLWFAQLHPDDKERWQEAFARTLNTGEHFKSDYRFIARDGRTVWVHGEARVVCDDEGRPLFLQGVAFDITESKSAEERQRVVNFNLAKARDQALEASRAKSAFLANMSHELRTPLNAIVGFAEMLEEDARDGGHHQFVPDLLQIHSAARHLLGMIGGILDLSKIEAGKMDLFLEPFDLADLIRDVVQSALLLVEENGNCLEVECPDDIGEVLADLTKVRQVLYNLLSNAAKFTSNGTITLRATRAEGPHGERFTIDVIDTGIGMTPGQLAGLFQSFTQADRSTSRKYGGTGLGLVISQRFSRMMGGDIRVSSAPDEGSTFSLVMPTTVVRPEDALEPEEGAAPERTGGQGEAILVIDDDAQVRDLMTRFLTRLTEQNRELARVRSERDAALAQVRSANLNWEAERAELLAKHSALIAEGDAVRRQVREQQHTIELLQAECSENNNGEAEQLRAEVTRLKLDRTRNHTPLEPATVQLAEATARHRQLACEIEELHQANAELRGELARTREATVARTRKKKKPRAAVSTNTPAPTATPPAQDIWYIVYRDEDGRTHKMTCSTVGIRMWFEKGLLTDLGHTLASRSNGGPFNPLTSYPEFHSLLTLSEPVPSGAEPYGSAVATAPSPATQNRVAAEGAGGRESVSLATVLIPLAVAVFTAVLAAQFLLAK
jgi:PAS domain S-box-containing protein